jgi:DNA-binding beta-propeller fold protein YncE
VQSSSSGVAVSVDGCTLLVSDSIGGSHAIHAFNIADGSLLRVVGGKGDAPLQFCTPFQVSVAADDGFVFVAELGNNRVQVLTPSLDFHAFIGAGAVTRPTGVCANADVVVVSEAGTHRISVFDRRDGTLRRRVVPHRLQRLHERVP